METKKRKRDLDITKEEMVYIRARGYRTRFMPVTLNKTTRLKVRLRRER